MTALAVVVPMLNEAAGITPPLEALAAQRDQDVDVVFVDNGSADATVAVVEAGEHLDPGWSRRGTVT